MDRFLEDVQISPAPLESTFFQFLSCIFTLLIICIEGMVIDMKIGSILEDVEISTAPLESTFFQCLSCIFTLLFTLYRKNGHGNKEWIDS